MNDDHSAGKTLQSLAIAMAYKVEWPLVILCPEALKYFWRYEILKWLPGISPRTDVQVLNSGDKIMRGACIIIASY